MGTQRGFAAPHNGKFQHHTVRQSVGSSQAHASLQDSTCHICPQEHPVGSCGRWSTEGWTLLGVGVELSSCLWADTLNSALFQPCGILPALHRDRLMQWSDPSSHRRMSSALKRDPADPHGWEQTAPCCYRCNTLRNLYKLIAGCCLHGYRGTFLWADLSFAEV